MERILRNTQSDTLEAELAVLAGDVRTEFERDFRQLAADRRAQAAFRREGELPFVTARRIAVIANVLGELLEGGLVRGRGPRSGWFISVEVPRGVCVEVPLQPDGTLG